MATDQGGNMGDTLLCLSRASCSQEPHFLWFGGLHPGPRDQIWHLRPETPEQASPYSLPPATEFQHPSAFSYYFKSLLKFYYFFCQNLTRALPLFHFFWKYDRFLRTRVWIRPPIIIGVAYIYGVAPSPSCRLLSPTASQQKASSVRKQALRSLGCGSWKHWPFHSIRCSEEERKDEFNRQDSFLLQAVMVYKESLQDNFKLCVGSNTSWEMIGK